MARFLNWSKLRSSFLPVAHTLMRAASRLVSTHGPCIGRSADAARKSACATLLFAGIVFAAGLEVPAGTELHVRLKTKVSTTASKAKDPVEAEVIAPVVLNGQFLIPAGTIIHGAVGSVKPSSKPD